MLHPTTRWARPWDEVGALEADLDAWAATLQEPGIPHQPINEQEVGWYARHFGHPE